LRRDEVVDELVVGFEVETAEGGGLVSESESDP